MSAQPAHPVVDADTHVYETDVTWSYLAESEKHFKPLTLTANEVPEGMRARIKGNVRYWFMGGTLHFRPEGHIDHFAGEGTLITRERQVVSGEEIVTDTRKIPIVEDGTVVRTRLKLRNFANAMTMTGFVVANFWSYNVAILAIVTTFQVLRIAAEERVLVATSDYASYKERVRWRLVPGLY